MDNEKIEAIAKRSARSIQCLISEMSEDIINAIHAATEQAQADGKENFTVTLSHSIKLDMGNDTQEDTLAVSVRHKKTIEGKMPDPSQPELPFGDDE